LRYPEISGLEQLPGRLISKRFEPSQDVRSVVLEFPREEPSNVLDHDGPRNEVLNEVQRYWKEISFVEDTKLLPGDAERRARNATSN